MPYLQWEPSRSCGLLLAPLKQSDDFLHAPNVVSDPRLNRWRRAERQVLPVEVVSQHVERDRSDMILDLL